MNVEEAVEGVRGLSDEELLAGLNRALGTSRRLVAWVLAHLAEVEQRRLHLLAGYSSLFAYCTLRLAMSEDEAYRRIRAAQLARRFPAVLERLASGEISLSVAALLEPYLTRDNHAALLAAVAHQTVARAREVLAAWFPRPDVLPFIRKLPERAAAASGVNTAAPSTDGERTASTPGLEISDAHGSAGFGGDGASPSAPSRESGSSQRRASAGANAACALTFNVQRPDARCPGGSDRHAEHLGPPDRADAGALQHRQRCRAARRHRQGHRPDGPEEVSPCRLKGPSGFDSGSTTRSLETPDSSPRFGDQVVLQVVLHVWQVVLGSPDNGLRTFTGQQTVADSHVVNPSENLTYPTAHFRGWGPENK